LDWGATAPRKQAPEEIVMGFMSRKSTTAKRDESDAARGGWYADPYGTAARRWYDQVTGWSKRVQGEGEAPDKTGLERMDEAAITAPESTRPVDEDGEPAPLSRPVDRKYMANARPSSAAAHGAEHGEE
jgi:hypothetical protein